MPEPDDARETPQVHAGAVAASVASYVLLVALAVFGLHAYYRWAAPGALFVKPQTFAEPRLITISDGVRDPEIAKQRAELESYRWIDRAHGVVQTPIESAMTWVVGRGADAYAPPPKPRETPK